MPRKLRRYWIEGAWCFWRDLNREKKPHPVGLVRHSFNFNFFKFYFNLRALAHSGARADPREPDFAPSFLSTVRDRIDTGASTDTAGCTVILVHAGELGLARRFRQYPLGTVLILSTRGTIASLVGTRTDPVQTIDQCRTGPTELPFDRNASRYAQCRVRKRSNECETQKRLVKSQRSGVALTERGGFWGPRQFVHYRQAPLAADYFPGRSWD